MTLTLRVLEPEPVASIDDYVAAGGGKGLEAARRAGPEATCAVITAAGLRGRGGAGFPTGRKWAAVVEHLGPDEAGLVVVNGAEGEPGSFKDRAILRANPYRVLEGALIAAVTVAADRVAVAIKASFATERDRLEVAIEEVRALGWADGIDVGIVTGPSEYLFGEETALLEVLDGRAPFPRIAPPFRRGADEMDSTEEGISPPTLVNNVETLANVPAILAEGPDWFRSVGTADSPGTVVCTITGRVRQHGVVEAAMGTPLRDVIEAVGLKAIDGQIVAAMSGVANPLLPAALLDTPVSYEGMESAGTGLGAAGFIVFDEASDLVAVAEGVSRFLSVESCGQCTPCKQDGLAITGLLDRLRVSDPGEGDLAALEAKLGTVADGARCFLAAQHQRVVESVLLLFPEVVRGHADNNVRPAEAELIAPIVDIVEGQAILDDSQARKQPDWTHDEDDSGQSPADRNEER